MDGAHDGPSHEVLRNELGWSQESKPRFRDAWESCNSPVFRFEPGLFEAFLNTDLPSEMEWAEVMLPFRCAKFVLDDPVLKVTKYWLLQPPGELAFEVGIEFDRGRSWASLSPFDASLPVLESIAKVASTMDESPRGSGHGRYMFTGLVNAVLFLSSRPDCAVRDPQGRLEALRARLARVRSGRKRAKLARAVERAEEIVVRAPPEVHLPTIDEGSGRRLERRVKVRGHWRRQPHGPGRSLRKMIWIAPFWRGPDAAEAALNNYRVPFRR